MKNYKEKKECWLMQEFQKALEKERSQKINIECGELDFSDGRILIKGEKIPVQIVTAEGISFKRSAQARKSIDVIAYGINPVECIVEALHKKVAKKYQNEDELIVLIEYSDLSSINKDYLLDELQKKEVGTLVKHFKEVYILSPSDGEFIKRANVLLEPVLIKI